MKKNGKSTIGADAIHKYKTFVSDIKKLTQVEEHVFLSAQKLTSAAKVNFGTLNIMVDHKLLERVVREGKYYYRWLPGEGEIADKEVIAIIERTREMQRIAKAKSPARAGKVAVDKTTKAEPASKVTSKSSGKLTHITTEAMEEVKEVVKQMLTNSKPTKTKTYLTTKIVGTQFTAKQLAWMGDRVFDKPTNVLIDGSLTLRDVRRMQFDVKDHTITVTFYAEALRDGEDTLSMATAEMVFVNQVLAFSTRYGDTTTGNLVINSYPYSLTTVDA